MIAFPHKGQLENAVEYSTSVLKFESTFLYYHVLQWLVSLDGSEELKKYSGILNIWNIQTLFYSHAKYANSRLKALLMYWTRELQYTINVLGIKRASLERSSSKQTAG